MKIFLISILFLTLYLSGCNSNNNENNNSNVNGSYSASRITTTNNNSSNNNDNNLSIETEISSFSTKIYTPNDEARQKNIKITCSKLNETVVKSRRNFFFLQYCR